MTPVLREKEPTAWFADWLLADPPPGMEVIMPMPPDEPHGPCQISGRALTPIRIEGTVVKRDGRVWVLTGRKWMHYWEGKWPD